MKKWMFSTAALLGMVTFALAADKAKTAGPMPGDQAPAFSLKDQNGKSVSMADMKDKVVVLEWFNDECPFVVKHYKNGDMNKLAQKYAGKEVVWLAINSTNGRTSEDDKAISTKWHIDRPILLDASGEVGKSYGSKNTPTMYIIKDGKIAYRGAIDDKSDSSPESVSSAKNYVAQALDEILAGKPVSEPMTKAYGCSVKYAK